MSARSAPCAGGTGTANPNTSSVMAIAKTLYAWQILASGRGRLGIPEDREHLVIRV